MSHGHGHGDKFYKENLKLFLQLFLYKYKTPFLLGVLLPVVGLVIAVIAVPFLFPQTASYIMPYQKAFLYAAAAVVGIALVLFLLGWIWRFLFLSGYTAVKGVEDYLNVEAEEGEILGHTFGPLIKIFILLSLLAGIGIFFLLHFKGI